MTALSDYIVIGTDRLKSVWCAYRYSQVRDLVAAAGLPEPLAILRVITWR